MNRNQILRLSLLLLVSGCKGRDKEKDVIASDSPFDKIKLTDLENKTFGMGQYKGKTIFLNFWATWCKPCLAEMPSIEKANSTLKNENIIFLLASSESIEEIDAFRNTHNYDFNYARIENSEELGIQVLPTTFIFNSEGKLVFSESGSRKWSEKSNIDMILKIANKNE